MVGRGAPKSPRLATSRRVKITAMTNLFPKLIVEGADEAIAFYIEALGATLNARYLDDAGAVVHAELSLGDGHEIAIAEAVEGWGWVAPAAVGHSSPVLLTLVSENPDAVAQQMVDHGANVLIPIDDRPYGKREGRVQDPFGHLWIITTEVRSDS